MTEFTIFDPRVVEPENYFVRYPELKRMPELENLTSREAIFIWWYANPTSPLYEIRDRSERVKKALEKSEYTPSKNQVDRILELRFSDQMAQAIDRVSQLVPSVRLDAWRMANSIFSQYKKIIERGTDDYTEDEVIDDPEKGQVIYRTVDHKKYVEAVASVFKEMPTMLKTIEEGFGVVVTNTDDEEDSQYLGRDFFKTNKRD